MEPIDSEATVGEVLAEANVSAQAAEVATEVAQDIQVLNSPAAQLPPDIWSKILTSLPKDDSAALMNTLLNKPAFAKVMQSPDFTDQVAASGTLAATTEKSSWGSTPSHVYTQHELDAALAVLAHNTELHVHVPLSASQQAALTSALVTHPSASAVLHDGVTLDTVDGGYVSVLPGAKVTSVTGGQIAVRKGATVTGVTGGRVHIGDGATIKLGKAVELIVGNATKYYSVHTADQGLVIMGLDLTNDFTVLDPEDNQLYPEPQ
ncbi:MAG: hypothetical protein H0T78_04220 [Longispora sp.]|nr:hypothetical protein [Longispora sp. (in: high G+C Gram-positive bacteria)]